MDADTDAPIEAALVFVVGTDEVSVARKDVQHADEAGRFNIALDQGPGGSLQVRAEGYAPQGLPVPDDASGEIVVRLARKGAIAGRVETLAGDPLGGVVVRAYAPLGRPFADLKVLAARPEAHVMTAITDQKGEFSVWGCDPETKYFVDCSRKGWMRWGAKPWVRAAGSPVVLRMRQVGRLAVLAKDRETGKFVGGLRASSRAHGPSPAVPLAGHRDFQRGDFDYPDGAVVLAFGVKPGGLPEEAEVQVSLNAPGYETKEIVVRPEFLSFRTVEVEMDRSAARRLLYLQARFGDGRAFVGPLVCTGGGPGQIMWFGKAGSAPSMHVPVTARRLVSNGAFPPGWWWRPAGTLEVAGPTLGDTEADPVRLVVRGAILVPDVRDADGAKVQDYDLMVLDGKGTGGWYRGWSRQCAGFIAKQGPRLPAQTERPFLWLPPGEVEIWVNAPGKGWAKGGVHVEAEGQIKYLRLDLKPGDDLEPHVGPRPSRK